MNTTVRAVISVTDPTDVQCQPQTKDGIYVTLGRYGLDVALLLSGPAAQRLRDELTVILTSQQRKASA